jgi:lipoate-protein ligase A
VLQHGSLPLTGDPGAICQLLAYPDESARAAAQAAVRAHAVTLADVLAARTDAAAVRAALVRGFSDAFAASLIPDTLTRAEQLRAEMLYATRFASDEWTLRR